MEVIKKLHWTQDKKGKWWYQSPVMKNRYGGIILQCEICNRCFPRVTGRKNKHGLVFCSKQCSGKQININISKGNNHYSWKGGRNVVRNGYIEIYKPEHPYCRGKKYVREHRLVMEESLGRYLMPWEQVHHRNGIKDDNRLENLELISGKVHLGEVECPFCQKIFGIR